jgi:hypothetical protein
MKKNNFVLVSIIAIMFLSNAIFAQSKFDKWTELKEFHTIMSQTFHPSEDGNLEPIKSRSAEMVTKAELLSKSKIPTEFDKKEVKEAITKLVIDSKKLNDMVINKTTDEILKKTLSELHDTFHLIVERCTPDDQQH